MKIASWNCQGLKSSSEWLRNVLLPNNYDLILLQETWLFSHETKPFQNLPNYDFIHVSSMPTHKTGKGRPYGGTAIVFKKSIAHLVTPCSLSDPRIISISVQTDQGKISIVNVYFPCCSDQNENIVTEYISKIESH